MARSKKIIIVDDHPIVLNGLRNMFKNIQGITVVNVASNGVEAMRLLQRYAIDIVVTDLQMPEMDGFELIENIKFKYPTIKLIVLTMHDDIWRIKKLMRFEVNSILSKSAGEQDMQNALNAIGKNEKYYDAFTKSIIFDILTQDDNTSSDPNNISFTDREVQILQFIYEGLTTLEIADKMNKSKNTIDTHRKNMFLKCDVKNIAGLLKYGLKKGYIDPS